MDYINNFFIAIHKRKVSLVKDCLIDVIEYSVSNQEINYFYELEYMIRTLSKLTKYSKNFILKTYLNISKKHNLNNKIIRAYSSNNNLNMQYIYKQSINELSSKYSAEIISLLLDCSLNYVNIVLNSN